MIINLDKPTFDLELLTGLKAAGATVHEGEVKYQGGYGDIESVEFPCDSFLDVVHVLEYHGHTVTLTAMVT